jgi:acetoin utilization deacetylase AcuC-like enzyme
VDYLEAFDRALEKTLKDFSPEFVLVSAGFDVMAQDPLGGMLLEPQDLYVMTRRIVEGTAADCNGKVVALLEGGYNPPRVGQGVVAVIRGLAGLEQP